MAVAGEPDPSGEAPGAEALAWPWPPPEWAPEDGLICKPKVIHAAKIAQLGLRGFLEQVNEQGAGFSTLNLAENSLGNDGVQVLAAVMFGSPNLNRLNLHDTGLGLAGLEHIGGLLQSCQKLETLVLSGNPLGSEAAMPEAFCRAVATAPALKALQLSECGLTDATLRPLLEALCARGQSGLGPLDRLTLTRNLLVGERTADLFGIVAASGALRSLDLNANSLGPKGAEALAQRLHGAGACGLRQLCMKGACLEPRGCRALLRLWGSSSGPVLEYLDLRDNGLTEACATELCRMVGKKLDEDVRFENGRHISLSWHHRLGVMNRRPHGGHAPLNVFWHDRD